MRMTEKSFTVAVAGASGYAGAEVVRVVAGHPHLELGALAAHNQAGATAAEVLPHLAGVVGDSVLCDLDPARLADHEIVVLALPHGASAALAGELLNLNPDLLVVDAGADFRLASARDWQRWYGGDHAGTWTYGLPELPLADGTRQRSRLVGARRIAGPGCNASAVALGLAPLVGDLVSERSLSVTLGVGTSGAGRSARPDLTFSRMSGGAHPYSVGGAHRHIPEILQSLRSAGAQDPSLSLTAVLVPMTRGIMAVCSGVSTTTTEEVRDRLQQCYADEPLIRVVGGWPDTHDVAGSAMVHLNAAVDPDSGLATVIVALDNLVKGTAGAVVQSINLALGLPETEGLPLVGLNP